MMSFFSIETFYFLSMGIVGILIIMLIFHFRNKIVLLEKQVQGLHDIASELVNDVRRSHVAQSYGLGTTGLENLIVRNGGPVFDEDEEEVPQLVIGPESADLGPVVEEGEPVMKTVSFDLPSEVVEEIVSEEVVELPSVDKVHISNDPPCVEDDDDKTVATVEGSLSQPLKKKPVSELRSLALAAGIEGAAKMKKADIVALLSALPPEPATSVYDDSLDEEVLL